MIAVASFQRKGWNGEINHQETDIFVMNVEKPYSRKLVATNGGWPSWGSDSVIFFHRMEREFWGVFRVDISKGSTSITHRVTPEGIHAMTPAAIDATRVAVATIREIAMFSNGREEKHYRHIEIFNYSTTGQQEPTKITQKIKSEADHFNPFVIDGGKRIGYNRCKSEPLKVRITFETLNCFHSYVLLQSLL